MKKSSGKLNLSFTAALILLVAPAIVFVIVMIFLMGSEMNSTYNDAESLYYDTLYQANSELVNADRDLYQALVAGTQYYDMIGNPEYDSFLPEKLADYDENEKQAIDRVKEAAGIAASNPTLYTGTTLNGKTLQQLEAEYETNHAAWLATYDFPSNTGDWVAFNSQFDATREIISDMTDIVEQWAEQEDAAAKKEISGKIIKISVIAAVVVFLIILVVILIARVLSRVVNRISGGIDNMSKGDFVTHLDVDAPVKEFRNIAESAENMRHNLHEALKKIIQSAQGVDLGASDAKDKITDSQRTTADINQAVSDLANGATSMAQDVQSTSNITINIGDSVENVLSSANSNMERGRTVYENSEKVQAQIQDLRSAGKNTESKAVQVAESVNETSAVVAEISNAAEAIMSIAGQTNLLALNASIEAARAGESGRGFAVVADNIKNLAEESNKTANEITSMLQRIITLSNTNKELTEDIKGATQVEAEALQEMSEAFDLMLGLLRETEEGNRQIVGQVESLNANKNSIMESVESLSSVSEENAASTQETSASLSMLDTNMISVVENAENLKQIAEELRDNVAMFTI